MIRITYIYPWGRTCINIFPPSRWLVQGQRSDLRPRSVSGRLRRSSAKNAEVEDGRAALSSSHFHPHPHLGPLLSWRIIHFTVIILIILIIIIILIILIIFIILIILIILLIIIVIILILIILIILIIIVILIIFLASALIIISNIIRISPRRYLCIVYICSYTRIRIFTLSLLSRAYALCRRSLACVNEESGVGKRELGKGILFHW